MSFDIVSTTSAIMEAAEVAAVLASQAPPQHGVPHPTLATGNNSKRELLEQGVESLLNSWRYHVSKWVILTLACLPCY